MRLNGVAIVKPHQTVFGNFRGFGFPPVAAVIKLDVACVNADLVVATPAVHIIQSSGNRYLVHTLGGLTRDSSCDVGPRYIDLKFHFSAGFA